MKGLLNGNNIIERNDWKMKKNVKKVENKGIDSTELIMALRWTWKRRGIKKDYVIES